MTCSDNKDNCFGYCWANLHRWSALKNQIPPLEADSAAYCESFTVHLLKSILETLEQMYFASLVWFIFMKSKNLPPPKKKGS